VLPRDSAVQACYCCPLHALARHSRVAPAAATGGGAGARDALRQALAAALAASIALRGIPHLRVASCLCPGAIFWSADGQRALEGLGRQRRRGHGSRLHGLVGGLVGGHGRHLHACSGKEMGSVASHNSPACC
jgi:hypothetical protein